MLSSKALAMKPSPTLQLVARAKELTQAGHDVISLSVGEPDWKTYPAPSAAGIKAIEDGFSKYTPAPGIPELREAIAKQFHSEINIKYKISQVTVGTGAKFVLFAAFQMLCNQGDEVIVPAPFWVSYPVMVDLAGGIPIIVETPESQNFKITPEQLEKAITPKTKAFVFSSPSNPTGVAYSAQELKALAEVFRRHPQVVIISDDIYNRLMLDGTQIAPHILQEAPDLVDRTVVINGVSKTYAMTGWRIGWALGPEPLIKAMGDYQSQATSSASSISQKAALAAIQNCDQDVAESVKMLQGRLAQALEQIKTIPGVRAIKPDGAFYIWMDVKGLLGKSLEGKVLSSSRDLALVFLEKYFVATVPGEEFGTPGFIRLSFAIESERMQEALARFKKMISSLS